MSGDLIWHGIEIQGSDTTGKMLVAFVEYRLAPGKSVIRKTEHLKLTKNDLSNLPLRGMEEFIRTGKINDTLKCVGQND